MADDQDFEKSELPSQRRRDEARAQGTFAYSHELVNGLLMLCGAYGLWWGGIGLAQGLQGYLVHFVSNPYLEFLADDNSFRNIDGASSLFTEIILKTLGLIGALIGGLYVVGIAGNFMQAGFRINSESIAPNWSKINPAENWQKLFSWDGVTKGGNSLAKILGVAIVAWWVLSDRGGLIISLSEGVLSQSIGTAWGLVLELFLTVAVVIAVLGFADYAIQWYRTEQRLKMSREELKQERKDDEGDPLIKSKRRQRARDIAGQRRMLEEVPKASLVITNPTHIAVALRYERGEMAAPVVIAKGEDQFALQIMAKARRHGIPVVERKPVARALYKMVKVGEEIPQALYVAVSEVLSYIYRLRGTAA
ncbi:MAG: EscU/YscU/HrcU family type III secretion system export apparatus switch protein [Planctomycetes bacterium]|nr:EscU/YscU/HrcU family type III secretion system export apparatus switch protein [Planctomycetota bacterium]